jgi:hypothetical protein
MGGMSYPAAETLSRPDGVGTWVSEDVARDSEIPAGIIWTPGLLCQREQGQIAALGLLHSQVLL